MAGVSGNSVNSIMNGIVFANTGYTTGFSGTNAYLTDGAGVSSALGVSTGAVKVNGTFKIGNSLLTLGGTVVFSGASTVTFVSTGVTQITLPTTGTIVSTDTTSLPNLTTANAITSASSLATIGTITSGTWHGAIVAGTYGGTGINNGSYTITLGGSLLTAGALTFSGAYAFTGTLTAATTVTFPTTGTLATLAGTETFTNKTLTSPKIATILTNSGAATLTLPTTTDTMVSRNSTDSLTNKTIISGVLATGVTGTALATKAQQVTGTDATLIVTTARQKDNKCHPKAWVSFVGSSGVINDSFGISGVVRNSTGNYTVSFSTAFAAATSMAITGIVYDPSNVGIVHVLAYSVNSATVIAATNGTNVVYDPTNVMVMFLGTQ